jgi:hypothetical protein
MHRTDSAVPLDSPGSQPLLVFETAILSVGVSCQNGALLRVLQVQQGHPSLLRQAFAESAHEIP